jgi:hypothetical protein
MFNGPLFVNISAAANNQSVAIDNDSAVYGSFQFVWVGLTGTLDGVMQVEVSDDNVTWDEKTGAIYTIDSSDGSQSISLNGVLTAAYCRLRYYANGISGGTINAKATVKGLN